jgi:hypothetical protein
VGPPIGSAGHSLSKCRMCGCGGTKSSRQPSHRLISVSDVLFVMADPDRGAGAGGGHAVRPPARDAPGRPHAAGSNDVMRIVSCITYPTLTLGACSTGHGVPLCRRPCIAQTPMLAIIANGLLLCLSVGLVLTRARWTGEGSRALTTASWWRGIPRAAARAGMSRPRPGPPRMG